MYNIIFLWKWNWILQTSISLDRSLHHSDHLCWTLFDNMQSNQIEFAWNFGRRKFSRDCNFFFSRFLPHIQLSQKSLKTSFHVLSNVLHHGITCISNWMSIILISSLIILNVPFVFANLMKACMKRKRISKLFYAYNLI